MAKAAGVVTIRLSAAQADLVLGLKESKAKVIDFGEAVKKSNAAAASATAQSGNVIKGSMIQSRAAVAALEGNFRNSSLAVTRFIAVTLKLGPALNAAFPIIGAVLLGYQIAQVSEKLANFYKASKEGAAKMDEAFRELNDPLRLVNDELRVANDRLLNDIERLEGKRQNNLQLALDEARVSADKLAISLGEDLKKLEELIKKQGISRLSAIFGNRQSTSAADEEIQLYEDRLNYVERETKAAVRLAKTKEEARFAQEAGDTRALALMDSQVTRVKELIAAAEKLQPIREAERAAVDKGGLAPERETADQTEFLREQYGILQNIQEARDELALRSTNVTLTGKKDDLEAAKQGARADAPFLEKLAEWKARLAGANAELQAIGKSDAIRAQAKATAEADEVLAKLNEEWKKLHAGAGLPSGLADQLRSLILKTTDVDLQKKVAETVFEVTTKLKAEAQGYQELANAIGKSYEAMKEANIVSAAQKALAEKGIQPGDRGYTGARGQIVTAETARVEGQHAEEVAKASFALSEQLAMQDKLIEAQKLGEQEILRLEMLEIIHRNTVKGTTELIGLEVKAMLDKYRLPLQENIDKLHAETDANKALALAELQGAEAARKQALENKYLEMQLTKQAGAVPAEREKDESAYQLKVTEAVAKSVNEYRNRLEQLDIEEAKIKAIYGAYSKIPDVVRALRELEDQRLKTLVQQENSIGKASDGIKAFFLEMQEQSKKAGDIIYESLNSALDRVSDQFAKFLTNQKTSFAKMFQSLGEETLKSSIKSAGQIGLGALGKALGITGKADGSSEAKALWVKMAGRGIGRIEGPGEGSGEGPLGAGGLSTGSISGVLSAATGGGGIFSALRGLFGGFSVPQSAGTLGLIPMAAGGDMSAGMSYLVGEREPEIIHSRSSAAITPLSKAGGGGPVYNIYAPGAELGAYNRIARGIEAAHSSAISASVRANHERSMRTPQRTRS